MLETRLKELVNHIKSTITLFGENAFFVDAYKDNPDGFHGVDDSIPNYFFIQQLLSDDPSEYVFDPKIEGDMYDVDTELILVAGLQCPILEKAIVSLTSALKSFADFDSTIESVSTNSEVIYKALYNQDYQRDEQLILIKFKVRFLFEINEYCDNDFCGDCCD